MTEFDIKQDTGYYATLPSLEQSISVAEQLLGGLAEGETSTFTVEADGKLVAAITNRRIIGNFTKQTWGGRKNDDAIYVGTEDFDATSMILMMDYNQLIKLQDNDESSDDVGRSLVDWSGPCEVAITTAVCDYFGVMAIEDITEDALKFARQRENPKLHEEETVTLQIKVRIRRHPDATAAEFVENLDYSVVSNTPGIVVVDTEIM